MSMISPTRNAGIPRSKANKHDYLPSFQQLQQTTKNSNNSKSSVASINTNNAMAHHPISPTSTADTTEVDGDMISTTPIVSLQQQQQQQQQQQRHGSDSLSQWGDDAPNDNSNSTLYDGNSYKSVTPQQHIGSLASMKELDIALNTVASRSSDANISMGGETAVTGNMSAFNNTPFSRRVTPRTTSKSSSSRDESPESTSNTSRRLFMCGAVDVTTEIKGSFQDVSDTVRQILTVRKFGPDERDAVKDTLKDAQSFMKQKVLNGILAKSRCGGAGARSQDDEDEDEDSERDRRSRRRGSRITSHSSDRELRVNSPKSRGRDDATARSSASSTVPAARRRRERSEGNAENDELAQESEEVLYDKSVSGMGSSELERLKVFEC